MPKAAVHQVWDTVGVRSVAGSGSSGMLEDNTEGDSYHSHAGYAVGSAGSSQSLHFRQTTSTARRMSHGGTGSSEFQARIRRGSITKAPRRGSVASQASLTQMRRSSLQGSLQPGRSAAKRVTANMRRSVSGVSVAVDPEEDVESEKLSMRFKSRCIRMADWILRLKRFNVSMFVLSVYTLYGDDLRLACFTKEADDVFNVITYICLLLFTLELCLASLAVQDYFLSFFFVLDMIATVSLVCDVSYIWEALVGYTSFFESQEDVSTEDGGTMQQSEYARAGRASRVGTRTARVLRVIRLIRVAKVFKIFLGMVAKRKAKAESAKASQADRQQPKMKRSGSQSSISTTGKWAQAEGPQQPSAESRVGKKLSERTTICVILLVIAMLVAMPLIQQEDEDSMGSVDGSQYGLDVIQQAWLEYCSALSTSGSSATELIRQARLAFEEQVLLYVYAHNAVAGWCPPDVDAERCAGSLLYRLIFLGFAFAKEDGLNKVATGIKLSEYGSRGADSWESDLFFHGEVVDWHNMRYIPGGLASSLKQRLIARWSATCSEGHSSLMGVSLVSNQPGCPFGSLRLSETTWFQPNYRESTPEACNPAGRLVAFFDTRGHVVMESVMSIARTCFIVVVLLVAALVFTRDTDRLVLQPIERMIQTVEAIRGDPLYAIKLGVEVARQRQSGAVHTTSSGKHAKIERKAAETQILENTIIKLGSLLALGFGEAGTEIIGQNLDDDDAAVDVLIPGQKLDGIFGFCHIHNFVEVTEILQEKTMVFVNQVAALVHGIVDEHLGAANRNLGDAFLLVWRIGLFEPEDHAKIADLAVLSFVKVLSAVHSDSQLAEYREHPALVGRLGGHYRVSVGIGLHHGWSIEGAIGSEFKIDASYLSSHVNLAMSLEGASRHYGVHLLVSEKLVRTCSPELLGYFRALDYVKFAGAKAPTRIFAVDLDCSALLTRRKPRLANSSQSVNRSDSSRIRHEEGGDGGYTNSGGSQVAQRRWKREIYREHAKMEKMDPDYTVCKVFTSDHNIRRMRAIFHDHFLMEWEKGFLNYEAGEWQVAIDTFSSTERLLRCLQAPRTVVVDGPSVVLLDFMRASKCKAPASWRGWRDFDVDVSTGHAEWRDADNGCRVGTEATIAVVPMVQGTKSKPSKWRDNLGKVESIPQAPDVDFLATPGCSPRPETPQPSNGEVKYVDLNLAMAQAPDKEDDMNFI